MTGIRHGAFPSQLGELLLVADGEALTGVYFEEHAHPPAADGLGDDLGRESGGAPEDTAGRDATLSQAIRELREYLAGERRRFDIALRPAGGDFEQQVWRMLLEIPYGETTSYGTLAERLGSRGLAQRVGQAVGRNPIMIAIPCHRVLGADGSLTGYAGGLDRKRFLLALEEPAAAESGRLF